jgi:hypothetical protein
MDHDFSPLKVSKGNWNWKTGILPSVHTDAWGGLSLSHKTPTSYPRRIDQATSNQGGKNEQI